MSDTANPGIDERHLKNLELVIKAAQDEYKQVVYDRRFLQHSILRNYTWLSSIMFGAQCMLLQQVVQGQPIFIWLLISAMILTCICFGLCIDTMRGRNICNFPYMDITFRELMDMEEYQWNGEVPPYGDKPHDADDMHRTMIIRLQESIDSNRKIANVTGIKLRCLSLILIIALPLTVLSTMGSLRYLFGL